MSRWIEETDRTSNELARQSPSIPAFIEARSTHAAEANGFSVTLTNCASAEIDAAITTCKNNNGGTVYLPACDVSLSDNVFRVPAGVSIIGSGRDSNHITAFLSDTVRVMPTGLHIYLPLAMK